MFHYKYILVPCCPFSRIVIPVLNSSYKFSQFLIKAPSL